MNSKTEENLDILKLSFTDIESMSPKDLYRYGKLLNIKDSTDFSDLTQKILLAVMKKKGFVVNTNFIIKDFQERKEYAFKEDELRRGYLKSHLTEIESIYEKIKKLPKLISTSPGRIDFVEKDDPLITEINNEFHNIERQFEIKKELVSKKPNCAILICGDSGAGKSSFINLLINEPLLPTSIRSNSACQVRLTYDQHERAEVIDREGNIIILEKRDFSRNLRQYLESLDHRSQLSCKSATVFLNCPILEGGLDIYDTIGIGESQLFNDELTKELKDITGILFLLKKNNPIGDNTVGGLSKIINYMAKYGIPGGSMNFILNMCDLLDGPKEKEQLKKDTIEQIRNKCGGLHPNITTFSTKRELFFQENEYMSKDYEDIITLIYHLHLNSINTNTVSIFGFLFRFAWKTIEYINECGQFASADKLSKKDFILKLRNLHNDRTILNEAFKIQNEKFLKQKYKEYKMKVKNHFKSEETMIKVVTDVISKRTKLFGILNNNEINKEIMYLTQDAILNKFKEFIEDNKMLKECCDQMLTTFLQQFAEHQKKNELINQEINRHIDSVMNYIKEDLTTMNFNDLIGLPIYQRKILQILGPIMTPITEFKDSITREIRDYFAWFISRINFANIQKFYSETNTYIRDRSISCYRTFINERKNIKKIMDILFEVPKQVKRDFEKHLADDMNNFVKNIDLLEDEMRNKDKVIQTYKDIKEKLENITNELCKINLLYLQKDKTDIMRNEIKRKPFVQDQFNCKIAPLLFNRSRILYRGRFKDTLLEDSDILVYKNLDGKTWKDLYIEYKKQKEISKNYLSQSNCFMTIRFHILSSINDNQDLNPMFGVKDVDHSLKTYMKEYKLSIEKEPERDMNLYTEICLLLQQILNGLSYLHSMKLVHYDLTIDSIGYNSTYATIKLSSIALETSVNIDYSSKSQSYVHEVSHFPRYILDKNSQEKYTSKSDIYCLGIILYQLWVDIHPFFNIIERINIRTTEKFVKILKIPNLNDMLLPHLFHGRFGTIIYAWVTFCCENKYTANSFYDLVEKESL